MKKTLSEIKQELAGTLERNRAMKWRYENTPEEERWGLLSEMGRQYNITRERVRQIVHRKDSRDTPYSDGFLSFLWRYVIGCLFGIKR